MSVSFHSEDPFEEFDEGCSAYAVKRLGKPAKVYRCFEWQWPNGACTVGFRLEVDGKSFFGGYVETACERYEKARAKET